MNPIPYARLRFTLIDSKFWFCDQIFYRYKTDLFLTFRDEQVTDVVVLVVAADPKDLPHLDVEAEIEAVDEALAPLVYSRAAVSGLLFSAIFSRPTAPDPPPIGRLTSTGSGVNW